MPKHLCLNMIVRNESARIIRALDSALPSISTFAILDTGSTDDTIATIEAWALEKNIKGVIRETKFKDFSQARNEALDLARTWHETPESPAFDYILLMDADMELSAPISDDLGLQGESYCMIQKSGGTSYENSRLLSILSPAKYIGATHEFLDANNSGVVHFPFFIDHADGANRPDKFTRDIKLLRKDLERDGKDARTWFYLANSYRDAGDLVQAAAAYRMRIQIGGWDEETWDAQVNLAIVLRDQGLEDAYVKEMIAAYNMRPQRAETLHELAKHYRCKGQNAVALLFIEQGITQQRPDDRLFVKDWVYHWGFREEFSIAGFYKEDTKERAYAVINGLALDSTVPEHVRRGARTNMVYYLPRLKDSCPSVKYHELCFMANKGYTAMNPCVTMMPSGRLEVLIRTVNYRMDEQGRYMIGPLECNDAPIETQNWLCELAPDYTVRRYLRVAWDRPAPRFDKVIGLEDMRIFWYRGQRHWVACCREQSVWGQCEQWEGILAAQADLAYVEEAHSISDPACTEKNWSPIIVDGVARYVYRLDTFIMPDGSVKKYDGPARMDAVENISGSSQWISMRGGYLAVVHEACVHPGHGKRIYQHRFAFYDQKLSFLRLSRPFVFHDVQIEFCAGLAAHPDGKHLVISFGERDEKAWLAEVSIDEVFNLVRNP